MHHFAPLRSSFRPEARASIQRCADCSVTNVGLSCRRGHLTDLGAVPSLTRSPVVAGRKNREAVNYQSSLTFGRLVRRSRCSHVIQQPAQQARLRHLRRRQYVHVRLHRSWLTCSPRPVDRAGTARPRVHTDHYRARPPVRPRLGCLLVPVGGSQYRPCRHVT